jgi:intracellular sulfur oxidation DsrE/DsrF family protein
MNHRRTFLARLAAGTAAFGAAFALPRNADAQDALQSHELDKWIDELKGQHKQVYDCVTKAHIGEMMYASNFLRANNTDYGLTDAQLASIVSLRHEATPYGYNDAMWEKYRIGESLDVPARPTGGRGNRGGGDSSAVPPADSAARATRNPQTNMIRSLADRGAQFTVCGLATTRYAGEFARKVNRPAADVRAELVANLVPNCRVVPAGVVVVNRAQERGFSYLYVG